MSGTVRGSVMLKPFRAISAEVRNIYKAVRWRTDSLLPQYLLLLRALAYRPRLKGVLFVAITGSAGKTTTKEFSASLLSSVGPCHSNFLSRNEAYNVAETILDTRPTHHYCVVEVAGHKPGALDWPLRFVKPRIAVLTLIQAEHTKAYSDLNAIAIEKGRLIRALPPNGTAVLNYDDPRVRAVGEGLGRRIIWVGSTDGASLRLVKVESRWPATLSLSIEYENKLYHLETQLHGKHLALSVLCALGVGIAAGMSIEETLAAFANVKPTEGRMEVVRSADGVTFVRDDWKAPLWSLEAPLAFMEDADAPRKVIVMGTLSDYSRSVSRLYPRVAKRTLEIADLVVFVGPHALRTLKVSAANESAQLKAFPDIRGAANFLRSELKSGDLVLLKGSSKVDHLVRLWLDRDRPIACWRNQCGYTRFCNACKQLYAAPANTAEKLELSDEGHLADNASSEVVKPLGDGEYLMIGLGNAGEEYARTRHNVGFSMLDHLVEASLGSWSAGLGGMVSVYKLGETTIRLCKPMISINNSGPYVREIMEALRCDRARCIVVHDDMDLELGDLRIKRSGGDGGHLGVRSVTEALGTGEFWRVRIGVRPQGDTRHARKIVHQAVSPDEEEVLRRLYDKGIRDITARLLNS